MEHGIKIIKKILGKRLRALVKEDKIQFGFTPERGTTDALFIEEYKRNTGKRMESCTCVSWI